jgi:hypothetical protein
MDNYDNQTWPLQITFPTNPGNTTSILMGVSAESTIYGPGQSLTIQQPARIKLFQNLESRAQIYAAASPAAPNNVIGSKVEYRAGKEISLLPEAGGQPGFEVKYGSDFTARIKRYVCADGDYGNGMKQNPNDPGYMSNDYENDDMNTMVPTHYVEHQKSDSDLYPVNDVEENNYTGVQSGLFSPQQAETDEQQENSLAGAYSQYRFLVMPNPSDGLFKVYANKIADDEIFTISIFDMKGQEIYTLQSAGENLKLNVDLTAFSKGIYLLKITSNYGFSSHKKIQVQ